MAAFSFAMRFTPCPGSEQPPKKTPDGTYGRGVCAYCNQRVDVARDGDSWKCVLHKAVRIPAKTN